MAYNPALSFPPIPTPLPAVTETPADAYAECAARWRQQQADLRSGAEVSRAAAPLPARPPAEPMSHAQWSENYRRAREADRNRRPDEIR